MDPDRSARARKGRTSSPAVFADSVSPAAAMAHGSADMPIKTSLREMLRIVDVMPAPPPSFHLVSDE